MRRVQSKSLYSLFWEVYDIFLWLVGGFFKWLLAGSATLSAHSNAQDLTGFLECVFSLLELGLVFNVQSNESLLGLGLFRLENAEGVGVYLADAVGFDIFAVEADLIDGMLILGAIVQVPYTNGDVVL